MINITRSGNNVIVTSDNPKAFNISNGELSVPMNSIYYVLDEKSDFIQFNSLDEKGEILFNGVIGDIQVNGTLVTREDIQVQLDSVFNTAGGSGGNSGVESVNGMTGAVTLKTINGQELTGLGDITIEGGDIDTSKFITNVTVMGDNRIVAIQENGNVPSEIYFPTINGQQVLGVEGDITIEGGSAGVEAINIGNNLNESFQKKGIVTMATSWYNGGYDVNVANTTFYGIKPLDSSIILENAGGTANGNTRCGIKVNADNFKTINGESIFGTGDITISGGEGGSGGTETDPIFEAWKNSSDIVLGADATSGSSSVAIGNAANASGVVAVAIGQSSVATKPMGIAIGNGAESTANRSIAIGQQTKASSEWGVAIGYNVKANVMGSIIIGANLVLDSNHKINIGDTFKGDNNNFAYVKSADGTYVQIHTEWTGTQSEYNALGTYYDTITYNIIEG